MTHFAVCIERIHERGLYGEALKTGFYKKAQPM